jgi:hypothetical protein
MVVTQVQGSGDQSSSHMNSLSSLATLAGLNMGPSSGQSAYQFRYYLDSLYSRDLANDLAKNKYLMKRIFPNGWDEQSQSWHQSKPTLSELIMGGITWALGARSLPWAPPDGAQLQAYLLEPGNLEVHEDIKRPDHAVIEIDSTDPAFAIELLNAVNLTANDHLRMRALRRTIQNIDYLSKELSTVTVAEHREAIMQSLSEQEKIKMSAGSGAPYAADVFEMPSVPLKRLSPRPSKDYPVALLKGVLVGAAIVLLLHYFGAFLLQHIRYRNRVERLPLFVRRSLRL